MLLRLSKWVAFGATILVFALFNVTAHAVPTLQLYIDGATYDPDTETWVYPGLEYDLWAIGANHEQVTIEEVKLAAAVKSGQSGTISITPLFPYEGVVPPEGTLYENGIPVKSDGKEIPAHGIYPSDFFEFQLGNFFLNEPNVPDFISDYDPLNPEETDNWGLIRKYRVEVSGYDWVHFDLYNHVDGDNHAVFAPFSHDADAEDGGGGTAGVPTPEPTTMLLLGSGLIGLVGFRRKFKKS